MSTAPTKARTGQHSLFGWSLAALLREWSARVDAAADDLPQGTRGYQLLTAVVHGDLPSQAALASTLGIDRTVMTYLLDDLEQAGVIERQPDPADRRARRIVATEAGRAVLCELQGKLRHVEDRVLGALPEDERAVFRALLRRVATRIDEHDPLTDACGPIEALADVQPTARARRRRS